jgi:hypothetical protein
MGPICRKESASPPALAGSSLVSPIEVSRRIKDDGDRRARTIIPTAPGVSSIDQAGPACRGTRNSALIAPSDDEIGIAIQALRPVCRNLVTEQGKVV